MSLTINVDTYITIQEMKEYVSTHFASTDSLRVQWEAMEEADQEVYLRNAFIQINSLPFTDRPLRGQPLPRQNTSLADARHAQAEQAVALTDAVNNTESEQRRRLQLAGVQSYRIGDLSETFGKGAASLTMANQFGLSERAFRLLLPSLRGGYPICTSTRRRFIRPL